MRTDICAECGLAGVEGGEEVEHTSRAGCEGGRGEAEEGEAGAEGEEGEGEADAMCEAGQEAVVGEADGLEMVDSGVDVENMPGS